MIVDNFNLKHFALRIYGLILGLSSVQGQIVPAHEIAFAEHDLVLEGGAYVRVRPPDKVAGFRQVTCKHYKASIATLRGWLTGVSVNGSENEIHYSFQPDIEWIKTNGVDLKYLLHAGNVNFGTPTFSNSPFAVADSAYIKVELVGWNVTEGKAHPSMKACHPPAGGWVQSTRAANEMHKSNHVIMFPFDPYEFEGRNYVEIEGSIIADNCHCRDDVEQVKKVKNAWGRTIHCDWLVDANFNDQSRYTEIHPPDKIRKLPEPQYKYKNIVVAVTAPWAQQSLEFDVDPTSPKPAAESGFKYVIDYKLTELLKEGQFASPQMSTKSGKFHFNFLMEKGGTPAFEYYNCPRYLAILQVGGWKKIKVNEEPCSHNPCAKMPVIRNLRKNAVKTVLHQKDIVIVHKRV